MVAVGPQSSVADTDFLINVDVVDGRLVNLNVKNKATYH